MTGRRISSRSKWATLLLLATLFVSACGSSSTSAQSSAPQRDRVSARQEYSTSASARDIAGSIIYQQRERRYRIHLPPTYVSGTPMSLVLAFHGGRGTPLRMAELTAFNNLADTAGFIVVYPEGYEQSWADGRNTTQAAQAGIDDVGFISALIDTLISNFSVDSARVYAAGISNGGNFVQRLGCELADKVVAIGVVAATSATDTALHCNPARPAPMTLMIGTEDTFFGVSETKNPDTLSADAAVAKRAALNGCAAKPSTTTLANIARDGTRVIS